MSHACHHFWKCDKTLTFCSLLHKVRNPLCLPRETISESPKSGPNVVCFVHFDLEMCFAPQRCALFDIATSKSCPNLVCFGPFWLRNVLRATTVCTFSTSQFPKVSNNGVSCTFWLRNVLRATTAALFRDLTFQKWSDNGVFCAFWTWKCASRHNGVQFFISHLSSCSAPAGVSRLSYLFAHLHLLSSDSFSSTLVSSNLSLLSASALLCFSSVHIVEVLTSKLPSTILAPHYHPSTYSKHVGFPEPLGPPEDIRLQQLLWLPHRSRCGSGCTSGSPSEQWEQRVSMLNTCLTVT